MSNFPELFERFAAEHYVVHRITRERQLEQRQVLTALVVRMGDRPITDIRADDIIGFMADSLLAGLHPNTVRKRLGLIKPFCAWLWTKRLINAEQIMDIKDVRPPRGASATGKPRPYTSKELRALWPAIDKRWPKVTDLTVKRYRNGTAGYRRVWRHAMNAQVRCVVALALELGLRRVEIQRLAVRDIHPDNAVVVVHGKRDGPDPKVREVPLTDSARSAIKEWFRWRRMLAPNHAHPWLNLWPSNPARELTFDQLSHMMSYVGDGWELHRLRHTCATARLRAGMKIEKLQRFLGHASLQQTLVYAELITDDIARDVDLSEAAFQRQLGRKEAA